MSEVIELPLLAKHFKNTSYSNVCAPCAIDNAAFDFFKAGFVDEAVTRLVVNDEIFLHDKYLIQNYYSDELKAKEAGFDNTIIRIINLTPCPATNATF